MYQSEWYVNSFFFWYQFLPCPSAPKWIRGAVVASYQWAITIGILIASIVNNATQNRPDSSAYRIPISLQFAWAIVLGAGMLFLPEVNVLYSGHRALLLTLFLLVSSLAR